jgi:hypothetical protein
VADGGPTDDETRIWLATREGLAVGSRAGHASGLHRGLALAEPILIVGLAVIFVLWLAHALLGVDVQVGIAPLLAGGGGGGLVGGAMVQGLRSVRARRTEAPSPDEG